jgi:hypothetical protein
MAKKKRGPFTIQVQLDREFQALGAFEKLGAGGARETFQRASVEAAKILQTTLVQAYQNGVPGLAPLHGFTVQEKGGDQPLFDTGKLSNAVELIIAKRGSRIDYMVGFSQADMARQAATLELGATIAVTDKMRRFLAWRGMPLKNTTKFIRIPSRPIFLRSLEKAQKPMVAVLQMEFEKELRSNRLQAKGAGTFWAKIQRTFKKAFG